MTNKEWVMMCSVIAYNVSLTTYHSMQIASAFLGRPRNDVTATMQPASQRRTIIYLLLSII
jgi:hypothetical protein